MEKGNQKQRRQEMPKTKRTSYCRKTKSYDEIKRHWGDIEVVDAAKDLRVFVQPEDVRSASAKDPGCCVFAQACKRQFAATKVLFWRSVAYVELPGPDGNRRVERFQLSPEMRDLIENFDKGNPVAELAGFELKKPRPSETFDGKSRRNSVQRARRKTALLKGSRATPKRGAQGDGKYSKPSVVVDLEVRNGSGRVHFKNEIAAV
jgi:hypothetical protein